MSSFAHKIFFAAGLTLSCIALSQAEEMRAGPDNYREALARLKPGDALLLDPGYYRHGLEIEGMNGAEGMPIVVAGAKERAVFLANPGQDTITLRDSSYIVLRNLEIDGRGQMVSGVRSAGKFAHHIVLENLYIHNLGQNQQVVGISSKCPAWDWQVRQTIIVGAGTGMYFGNSNNSHPFVGGIIENNLILNTIGYNLQIKHQGPRPDLPGMPSAPRATVIRHNVFIKASSDSASLSARPNVLVGHWPLEGPGKDDMYLIYGNLFYENPSESLFQGEGRIALYNNLFYNSHKIEFPAIAIQPHNDIPRKARVFFNTILHPWKGIRVLHKEGYMDMDQEIVGNAVFAKIPIQGGRARDNVTDDFEDAPNYLQYPAASMPAFSLFPKSDKLRGAPIDLKAFAEFPGFDRDFDGERRDGQFRGAYSGTGTDPGWRLAVELKSLK
jgi:hypothetical protein